MARRNMGGVVMNNPYLTTDNDDTDWKLEGICRTTPSPDAFFPEQHSSTRATAAIRRICETCPVQQQCLEYALTFPAWDDYGIWGGTSAQQRRDIRRQRREVEAA